MNDLNLKIALELINSLKVQLQLLETVLANLTPLNVSTFVENVKKQQDLSVDEFLQQLRALASQTNDEPKGGDKKCKTKSSK